MTEPMHGREGRNSLDDDHSVHKLGLSVRTSNALHNAGIKTLGQLRSLNKEQLLEIRNIGSEATREIEQVIGRVSDSPDAGSHVAVSLDQPLYGMLPVGELAAALLLLETAHAIQHDSWMACLLNAYENMASMPMREVRLHWRMGPAEAISVLAEITGLLKAIVDGHAVSPTSEALAVVRAFERRKPDLVIRRLGLSSGEIEKLQDIGDDVGISRERVRQIVDRFETNTEGISPPLPFARALVQSLEEFSHPVTLKRWWNSLPLLLRPPSVGTLGYLIRLKELGWLRGFSVHRFGNEYLACAGEGRESEVETWGSRILARGRQLKAIGAVQSSVLAGVIGSTRDEAEVLLGLIGDWALVVDDWFVLRSNLDSVLRRRATQMLSICGALKVEDIRRGLARDRRLWRRCGMRCPPTTVLAAILDAHDVERLIDLPEGERRAAVGGAENALVGVLRTVGTPMTSHEVRTELGKLGYSTASAGVLMSYSSLIRRAAPGVYVLRGSEHPAHNVRDARKRAGREDAVGVRMVKVTTSTSNSVAVHYIIRAANPQFIEIVPIRPGTVPRGSYRIDSTGETAREARVRQSYVTGVLGAVRSMARAGASRFILEFDLLHRSLRVEYWHR
jgi:hypothetical protein